MKLRSVIIAIAATATAVVVGGLLVANAAPGAVGWKVIAWNDLGMHCMDGDFSVFSILPPYNNVRAQVIDSSGQLAGDGSGLTVTYEAVADTAGSVNSTSVGKTDFWDHALALFGAAPGPDQGLAGFSMPGTANVPQAMAYHAGEELFSAEGIPLTPVDDAWLRNSYPMMRISARDVGGAILATTDVVLPVSDEMDCSTCHRSGSVAATEPSSGWAFDCDEERDFKRNILALHDDLQAGNPLYASALATAGYDPAGLAPTAASGTSVLCARCHGSNALPGTGITGVSALTKALHGSHATVIDPVTGMTLDDATNRSACYRCHPGAETRCLRGAMGDAVAADGSLAMQCQSCHGSMSRVGGDRAGWFDEPNCQSCHTGTATHNNGQIRYTSVFEAGGDPRVAVDSTFATNPDTPFAGVSLYRFSTGHGGLQCEACHGSTHAVYPSSHANDNVQSLELQGHVGVVAECSACHDVTPDTINGGPHGMHPVGQTWVNRHGDAAEHGSAACRACHGTDSRGTVLSRVSADRTLSTRWGSKSLFRGAVVGCWECHNGPSSEDGNPNLKPVASAGSLTTSVSTPAVVTLAASDADGDPLTRRILSQPALGTVALAGTQATFYPLPGRIGVDDFTFAARDGDTDSNLATVSLEVRGSFGDVEPTYWAGSWVERLYQADITAGCSASPLLYCPEASVSRAQMAVFLVKSRHGVAYTPPPATGVFADVPTSYWAARWIEQLAADGVTSGCGGGLFCPDAPTSRAEMAVFLLRASGFSGCTPPPATGAIFSDVPADYWAASWIEELVHDGVTAGCGGGGFCPDAPVSRAQMGVFLVKTFALP